MTRTERMRDRALMAWVAIRLLATHAAEHQPVTLGDTVAHRAIESMGGWPVFWRTIRDDRAARMNLRAGFLALYPILADTVALDPPVVVGWPANRGEVLTVRDVIAEMAGVSARGPGLPADLGVAGRRGRARHLRVVK